MRPVLLVSTLNFLTCFCQKVTVTQDKKFAVVRVGQSISLSCEYEGPSGAYNMYWYQQKSGKGLELMGLSLSLNDFTPEKNFSASWVMERPKDTHSTLTCQKVTSDVSAMYFCAASYHSHKRLSGSQPKTCIT